jgi:UDPglucose 6-dehydrogenase
VRVAVIGAGYVGLVTAAALAELGNDVACMDIDADLISRLSRGEIGMHEPGLEPMVRQNLNSGRLRFTTDLGGAVSPAEVVFIGVGTFDSCRGTDLTQVEKVARAIAGFLTTPKTIVTKSTVSPGTTARLKEIIAENAPPGAQFQVLANPEFLREGKAVEDAMRPERIVIGAESDEVARPLLELYRPLNAPVLVTDLNSAETVKYASNAFLATRISFINSIADLCDRVGADVVKVAEGMGLDSRIGRRYLEAGLGFGGSCLPKDTQALIEVMEEAGCDASLFRAVVNVNDRRIDRVLDLLSGQLGSLTGRRVAVLGLAFKAGTSDTREAKAIALIERLLSEGAVVHAHDPLVRPDAPNFPKEARYFADPYEAARGCDAVVLATDWEEYARLDLGRLKSYLKRPLLVDGRDMFDPEAAREAGLQYLGVGRR